MSYALHGLLLYFLFTRKQENSREIPKILACATVACFIVAILYLIPSLLSLLSPGILFGIVLFCLYSLWTRPFESSTIEPSEFLPNNEDSDEIEEESPKEDSDTIEEESPKEESDEIEEEVQDSLQNENEISSEGPSEEAPKPNSENE